MMRAQTPRVATVVFLTAAAVLSGACDKGGKGKESAAAQWVDDPSGAKKDGKKYYFSGLDVEFEVPDTLYVFRNCSEASHSPEGEAGWIPVLTCSSEGGGGGDETSDFAAEGEEGGGELVSIKFYATKKTRPIDERTVSWFENQYREAGFEVDEISFQHDYQNKSGIYAKLQVIDPSSGMPSREIIQFMFPKEDVLFIARTEYTFGDSRAIPTDWKYILWNFDIDPKGGSGAPATGEEPAQ